MFRISAVSRSFIPNMMSAPLCTSHHCRTQLLFRASTISWAASNSGKTMELIPIRLKKSRCSGCRYSSLSMRATVFLAPMALASIQQVMFLFSSGVTAIKRSASAVPASLRPLMEVGETLSVIRSKFPEILESFCSLSSISTMS